MAEKPTHRTSRPAARLTRREAMLQLLRVGGVAAGAAGRGVWLSEHSFRPVPAQAEQARRDHRIAADPQWPHLTVVQGGEPRALVQRALDDLGGISRFVSRQDVVVIKPNIAWDRTPEQAANTNPEVVAEVVRQCWQAGAKRVIVTDVSCNEPRRCFHRSGIQAAARAEGAEVILPDPELFREVDLGGVVLKTWPVFTPFLEADKIINLPIAKHHVLTGATLGMKNWYGILGGERNRLHQQIHQSLVDLASFMLPTRHLARRLPHPAAQRSHRRQPRRRGHQEDHGRRNRSRSPRRLCGQSLLEPRSRAPALSCRWPPPAAWARWTSISCRSRSAS